MPSGTLGDEAGDGLDQLSDEEIADLFREAQTKDASYALSAGIVQEIKDVPIPTRPGLIRCRCGA